MAANESPQVPRQGRRGRHADAERRTATCAHLGQFPDLVGQAQYRCRLDQIHIITRNGVRADPTPYLVWCVARRFRHTPSLASALVSRLQRDARYSADLYAADQGPTFRSRFSANALATMAG